MIRLDMSEPRPNFGAFSGLRVNLQNFPSRTLVFPCILPFEGIPSVGWLLGIYPIFAWGFWGCYSGSLMLNRVNKCLWNFIGVNRFKLKGFAGGFGAKLVGILVEFAGMIRV